MMKRAALAVAFTLALTFHPTSAHAYAPVQQVQASEAQQGRIPVTVWAGSGTNIDFSRLEETIYRVWLDDPSKITVDFDASLEDSGAQIVHLRRIQGVRFEGLPATARTLLTVVTRNSTGQTTLYQFSVSYGTGEPSVNAIALLPSTPAAVRIPLTRTDETGVSLDAVQVGLSAYIADGTLPPRGEIESRVTAFLQSAQEGKPIQQALTEANVSLNVVQRLAARGQQERILRRTQQEASAEQESIEGPRREEAHQGNEEVLWEDN